MREYPDPRQHIETHMQRSAQKYAEGLWKAGLSPTYRLVNALAERAANEAKASYEQEADEVLQHNIGVILGDHERRMNEIKRSGRKWQLWTCPPIAAVFGAESWYHFAYSGDMMMGIAFAIFALVFLGMLAFGVIFDRPTKQRGGRHNG